MKITFWHAWNNTHRLIGLNDAARGALLAGGVALGVASPPASTWVRADDSAHYAENSARADADGADAASATDSSDKADESKRSRKLLETVTVTGRKTPVEESREELDKIPGAVSVIDNADIERGRASNLEDVLALQPGIFAQSTSGSEANKISIRGSGLNAFYGGYSLGLTYLYDGIPITGRREPRRIC